MASTDVCSSGAKYRCIAALCPTGAKLHNLSAFCRTNDAICLRRNQTLMIDGQQNKGFNQLSFNSRSPNCHNRLLGENRCTFRNSPDITGKPKILEIFKKILGENIAATKIFNIFSGKMEIPNIIDDLFKTRCNCKAAVIRASTEEYIKVANSVLITVLKISITHGKFIEIAEHCQIQLIVGSHVQHLFRFYDFIIKQYHTNSNPFIDTIQKLGYIQNIYAASLRYISNNMNTQG